MRDKVAFQRILPEKYEPVSPKATGKAPVNIALIKYWGKRDAALNLPITDSLSIAIQKYTTTTISETSSDIFFLNGTEVAREQPFYRKLYAFLSYVRPHPEFRFEVRTKNDVPTASGLASSASGFCALVQSLDAFFGWNLEAQKRSCLARLGSGSACRSIYPGFVHWKRGVLPSGEDSYATPIPKMAPELTLGLFVVSKEEKSISSRDAMERTVLTSPLYTAWPATVSRHIDSMLNLLEGPGELDFVEFGKLCEQNSFAMHATMASAFPPIIYWKPETLRVIEAIFHYRSQPGAEPLFITMDAGPNVKVLCMHRSLEKIRTHFPEMEVVQPLWT